jgi:formylglycine-generating enzyme required for sulfatase activity
MGRYALLIGCSEYTDDKLLQLAMPEADVQALAQVLEDEQIGAFDAVDVSLNEPDYVVRRKISRFFKRRSKDDFLLLFFAGHGVKDRAGQLYLTFTNTEHDDFDGTAIPDAFVARQMDRSKAESQLLILDCCYSGAFGRNARAGLNTPVGLDAAYREVLGDLQGIGRMIFAATDAIQFAWEGESILGEAQNSLFTHFLIQGLLTGEADQNNDNVVTLDELYTYVYRQVRAHMPEQQPQLITRPGAQVGELVVALTPHEKTVFDLLPERLAKALTDENAQLRFFALAEAERYLATDEYGEFVQNALREMALHDPDTEVKQRAMDILLRNPETVSDPTPSITVSDPTPPPPKKVELYPFEPETVLIPAGDFLMGSPTSDEMRYDDEPEQYTLFLDAYRIGKYPVTVAQYRAFVEDGGYANRAYWTDTGWQQREKDGWTEPRYWNGDKYSNDDQLPVVGVSWYECYAYTQWLSEATDRSYTLPTEAQWEKASRGGLKLADGGDNPIPDRIWPWGNTEPTADLCNFEGNVGQTSPVTSHPAQADAQPYGLHHMAGNVWEWCLSAWSNPFEHPEQNAPEGDSARVVRGGSWHRSNSHWHVRCSCRYWSVIVLRNGNLGFRVAGVSL